ncbi:hypothetical protein [Nocardia farcinica]
MTIDPMQDAKPPADVAADLRALADLAEKDPFMSAVIERFFRDSTWPAHAASSRNLTEPTAAFDYACQRLAALPGAGKPTTDITSGFTRTDIPLRAITVRLIEMTADTWAAELKELGF